MDELNTPKESVYKKPTENRSSPKHQQPLSPVLGSGQHLKLMKIRKERHKRSSKKIAKKLEHDIKLEEQDNEQNSIQKITEEQSIPGNFQNLDQNQEQYPKANNDLTLESDTNTLPENLIDRIQFLENLEAKKRNIITMLSFSNEFDETNSKAESLFPAQSKETPKSTDSKVVEFSEVHKLKTDLKENNINQLQNNISNKIHFKKGTGENIEISEEKMKISVELFKDILDSNNCSKRNKKYSYLSKNKSSDKILDTNIYPDVESDQNKVSHLSEQINIKEKEISLIKVEQIENITRQIVTLENKQEQFYPASISKKQCESLVGTESDSENVRKLPKTIFDGFDFSDINFTETVGFKPVSVSTMVSMKECGQSFKDKRENYNNSNIPATSEIITAPINLHPSETLKNLNQNDSQLISSEKKQQNIFDRFDLNDITCRESIAFKSASMTIKELENKNVETKTDQVDDLKPISNKEDVSSTYLSNKLDCEKKTDGTSSGKLVNSVKIATKNIFNGFDFSDLNCTENIGFKPATISLKKSDFVGNLTNSKERSFKSDTLKKELFPNIVPEQEKKYVNHGMSELKSTNIQTKSKSYRNIFEGIYLDDLNMSALGPSFSTSKPNNKRDFVSPFKTPIKNKTSDLSMKTNERENDFPGFDKDESEISTEFSQTHCDIINAIENSLTDVSAHKNHDIALIKPRKIEMLSNKLLGHKQKLKFEQYFILNHQNVGRKRKFSEVVSDHNSVCQNSSLVNMASPGTSLQNSFLKRPKKRLGCHVTPTIQLSETVLKRAKLLFEDIEPNKRINTSTPIKFDGRMAPPIQCNLTPIQGARNRFGNDFSGVVKTDPNSSGCTNVSGEIVSLFKTNPSERYVEGTLEKLSREKRDLEERLKVLREKQVILCNQQTIIEFSAKGRTRILPGSLYKSKRQNKRISLRDYVNRKPPGMEATTNSFLNQINPKNAHMVHFTINERLSHIETLDGAKIVPDLDGKVGVSEIEHSFKALDGVDPKLIPKGWIPNHYKWIIWKLVSYERMYPDKFEGVLCIENVVQQLKYRYDVEIDQAKRSSLHKIFEKDDCSQRRLVLCVSQIIKINDSYELELTDGWYSIRATIDRPLCNQIIDGKIKIGVKLVTYGAELVSCDGCHPLEATKLSYLKINYNCTRRAVWWAKLGCQKESGPFPVPLDSVHLEGGKIGCIKCYIVRVYPVKYMETCGNKNVWRNRKADERREQEYYNEKVNALERTNKTLDNVQSKNKQTLKGQNIDLSKRLKNVDDPEILYNIIQNSFDPESLQENLSTSQKTLLYNYSLNKSVQNKADCNSRIQGRQRLIAERTVKSLLKLKLVDASLSSETVCDFYVWKPQESHMQELKEGHLVTIYNSFCSLKWGLSSSQITRFRREMKAEDGRFHKFKRKYTAIENLRHFFVEKEILPEFDTVGLVVRKKIDEHYQQVWLTDGNKSLLVIKIYDSPKRILVLDTVIEGQVTTVCNLMFKRSFHKYCFCAADHFVVFARYSQHKHLQEAADALEKELNSIDVDSLLSSCKVKIDRIEEAWDNKSPSLAWDIDDMECSQITTTDLALLECVDKLTLVPLI